MPKIYSVDLREKVMKHYHDSQHKSQTCHLFNIARTTLDDWIKLEQQTGQLKQPKIINSGRQSKIKDMQAFQLFVETPEFSQAKELLPLFAKQFTYEISYRTLLTALHKIGWIYKKRVLPTKKVN